MAFVIITDSASDTPKEVQERYNLPVIPTPVTIDGTDYFDGDTIFVDEFYAIQAEGTHDIKTYHVSQYTFRETFRPYAERGDELLYLCFSTGIAGTYNAARLAVEELQEEYPDFKITIIDTKCGSIAYGMVARHLKVMQENGASPELLIEAGRYLCAHMRHVIIVKTLDYLVKGGRISKTSAIVGSALDIKPIIRVNEDGALYSAEKVRGWKKALKRGVEIVREEMEDPSSGIIGICHGNVQEDYDLVKSMLEEQFHPAAFFEGRIGCAIGAHTGPGVIGIGFIDKMDEKYAPYLK